MSYSIEAWCERHSLSRSMYYKLVRAGKAPRTIAVLTSIRITEEADREWVAAREAEADTDDTVARRQALAERCRVAATKANAAKARKAQPQAA
jgi:predicted DNA-binding transcriptional regulator AlpA